MPKQMLTIEALEPPEFDQDGFESLEQEPDLTSRTRTVAHTFKRTIEERQEDLEFIRVGLMRGKTARQISKELTAARPYKVCYQQVLKDRQSLFGEWRAKHALPISTARARELERIEFLEHTAWEAYERSTKPSQSVKVETIEDGGKPGGGGKKTTKQSAGQSGDAGLLGILVRLHERRCKILGLDAPTEMSLQAEVKDTTGETLEIFRTAYRKRILAELTGSSETKVLPQPQQQLLTDKK